MSYEDTVLIKLRRDYSKDEMVMFVLNKIKELQIESGKDKSYIDELEAEKRSFGFWIKNNKKLFEVSCENKNLINQIKVLKEQILKFTSLKELANKNTLLQSCLKKEIQTSKISEEKNLFFIKYIKANLSESKLQEFYKAKTDFYKNLNKF